MQPRPRRERWEQSGVGCSPLRRPRPRSRSWSPPAARRAPPAACRESPSTSITFGTHQPLTGPAAPGYSEIAPASQAYFDYVNAHGGVYGRKIHLIIKDDAYNPAETVNVVHQLVLQDKVFGIFEGLGTPTHTKVVGFLNASKIPDMFVASGCPCWDNGTKQPMTFGWQPNYTIEGKILGQYIKQHFAGQKVGVLYQDDDFGQGGLAGIEDEVPARRHRLKAALPVRDDDAGAPDNRAQGIQGDSAGRLHGADLHRDRAADLVHAGVEAAAGDLECRDRPDHGRRAAEGGLEGQGVGNGADRRRDHRRLSPSNTDTSNPWIQLFMKIHAQYDPSAPFDGNVEYGMANAYTLVQALRGRGQEPDPPGHRQRGQQRRRQVDRAGPGPVPLHDLGARRLWRRRAGSGPQRQDRAIRRPAHDGADRRLRRSRRTRERSRRRRRTESRPASAWCEYPRLARAGGTRSSAAPSPAHRRRLRTAAGRRSRPSWRRSRIAPRPSRRR